jgi:hypothetical protein
MGLTAMRGAHVCSAKAGQEVNEVVIQVVNKVEGEEKKMKDGNRVEVRRTRSEGVPFCGPSL